MQPPEFLACGFNMFMTQPEKKHPGGIYHNDFPILSRSFSAGFFHEKSSGSKFLG